MIYAELKPLASKPFFTVRDLVQTVGVKPASARVLCSRYVKKGIFVRLKNDFYVLDQAWEAMGREDFFLLANFLQVPSYASLLTALSWQGISSQVPRGTVENIGLRRSVRFEARGSTFRYYRVQKALYFGFAAEKNFFIATPEKAFADTVYLCSLGRYAADFSALNMQKLDQGRLKRILKAFPQKTCRAVERLCKT